jgi:hypothetical protein
MSLVGKPYRSINTAADLLAIEVTRSKPLNIIKVADDPC